MCASPLEFFRAGPPPPKVVLLPGTLFFCRVVPVVAEADGKAPDRAAVANQAQLALEAMAPFPLAQLFHGFYWRPGAARAVVYAAYRRRFTADQTFAWQSAELVIPGFAALLGAEVEPATTLVLHAPEGLTVVHWDASAVPAGVWFHPLAPDAPPEDAAQARESLLRRVESKTVIDLAEPPAPHPSRSDREFLFRSGELVFRLPAEAIASLDIRDRDELDQLRRHQKRGLILWRVGVGGVAAMLLLGLGEGALFAGDLWQKARRELFNAQAPGVAQIMTAQEVADRINELSSKRLLPIEMIRAVAPKRPPATQFLRASTSGLYTLTVEAQTSNAAEIGLYKSALDGLPACASVEIKNQQTRNKVATFTLVVTFKPGALKSGPAS